MSDDQRLEILETPKGEMIIPCVINDRESESARDPIVVEMTWAWIPKSELEARRQGNHSKTQSTEAADNDADNNDTGTESNSNKAHSNEADNKTATNADGDHQST